MNQKIIFWAFALFLFGCANRSPQKAEYHLKIGSAHLQRGNFPAAMSSLLKAVELDSKNAIAHNNLGLSYFVRKKLFLAKKHLKTSLQLKPDYTDARVNLGRIYLETLNYKKAISHFRIASQDLTYTNSYRAFYFLGLSYFQTGKYRQANRNFRKSLETNNKSCPANLFYGRSYLKLNKISAASKVFKKVLSICTKNYRAEAIYYNGFTHLLLGESSKTREFLKILNSEYPETQFSKRLERVLKR